MNFFTDIVRYKTMFEFEVSIDRCFIDTLKDAIRVVWTSLDSFLHTAGEGTSRWPSYLISDRMFVPMIVADAET